MVQPKSHIVARSLSKSYQSGTGQDVMSVLQTGATDLPSIWFPCASLLLTFSKRVREGGDARAPEREREREPERAHSPDERKRQTDVHARTDGRTNGDSQPDGQLTTQFRA